MNKINVTKTNLPELSEYVNYLEQIWENNWVTNNGQFCIDLEQKLKKFLSIKNLISVSNGTIAIQMALKALKLKGEVITTPFTFPATTNAIMWEGFTPVFSDIDPETFNLDPDKVEAKITKITRAILAVHVYGNPCELEKFEKIGKKYKIKIIYDAAHAFGVKFKNKSVLNYGDANTLSFHATKIFHTVEGGAIITKSKIMDKEIKLMRNHGIEEFRGSKIIGTNAKLSELHAAMGLCSLNSFSKRIIDRRKRYKLYVSSLDISKDIKFQKLNENMTYYNYAYFPIVFRNQQTRDGVFKKLHNNNIFTRKYFYPPCHKLPYINYKSDDLRISERISNRVLCLPLYDNLEFENIKKIVDIINKTI